MRKAVYICLIALLLSACANNAQAEKVDTPEISAAVTAITTTTVPSASTTTVSAEEKEIIISSTTIASEESETSSETTESTTSTERENEAATSQTEVSVSDKTGTSMATSASVSESKPKVTTVSSAPKKSVSHTTTEAPIQTTTEKPKDTTTTAATTTTTTAAPSGVKWSDSMKVWRKLCEGKKLTGSEQDLIRSEILDYAVSSFNGKKDIHVSFGIDSYDISYEKPLNMKANKKMTSMSNAHMDAYADPNRKAMIDYAKSENEIYDIVSETRNRCLHVTDYGLFNRWEIFTIYNELKYASDIDFGIGFDEDMTIWFLTQD